MMHMTYGGLKRIMSYKENEAVFYHIKENEESQVVNHNLCLIANPFACEQDSQKTDLSITMLVPKIRQLNNNFYLYVA